MSSLTAFRDHCRTMAVAKHKPECPSLLPKWMVTRRQLCDGCVTDTERELFRQLAGEVDDYLDTRGSLLAHDLFGGTAVEPVLVEDDA